MLVGSCSSGPPVTRSLKLSQTLMYPLVDLRDKDETSIERCDKDHPVRSKGFFTTLDSKIHFASDHHLTLRATEEDFSTPNLEKLKTLAPKGYEYISVVFLRKFDYGVGRLDYRIEAYVVRTDQGNMLWTNTLNDFKWLGVVQAPIDQMTGKVLNVDKCIFLQSVIADTFIKMPKLPPYVQSPSTSLPTMPESTSP